MVLSKGKGKAIPLPVSRGPDVSGRMTFRDFKKSAHEGDKIFNLMYRPSLPPEKIRGTHLLESVTTRGTKCAGSSISMKNSNENFSNRTRDYPKQLHHHVNTIVLYYNYFCRN